MPRAHVPIEFRRKSPKITPKKERKSGKFAVNQSKKTTNTLRIFFHLENERASHAKTGRSGEKCNTRLRNGSLKKDGAVVFLACRESEYAGAGRRPEQLIRFVVAELVIRNNDCLKPGNVP